MWGKLHLWIQLFVCSKYLLFSVFAMTEISLTCKTIGSNVRGKSDTRIARDSSCAKQNNNIQQNKNENTRFSMTCGVICANVCSIFYDIFTNCKCLSKIFKNKSEIASSASKNYRLPVYVFVHFQVAGKSSPEIIGIFLLAWVPLSLHRFLVQSCKSINRQQKERSIVRWKKCLCFSSDQGTLSLWILPGQIFSHTIRRSTAVHVDILLLRQV